MSDVVTSALELVNMQEAIKRATHTLSGGQRQRVAIAGARGAPTRLVAVVLLTAVREPTRKALGLLAPSGRLVGVRADHSVRRG